MKGTAPRLGRTLAVQLVKIAALLLAVSIIAFALVCASPIDPVQQYILGLGTAVSAEQRAEIEAYWGVNEPPDRTSGIWAGSRSCSGATWANPPCIGGLWPISSASALSTPWP